jgi:hypothetical protein
MGRLVSAEDTASAALFASMVELAGNGDWLAFKWLGHSHGRPLPFGSLPAEQAALQAAAAAASHAARACRGVLSESLRKALEQRGHVAAAAAHAGRYPGAEVGTMFDEFKGPALLAACRAGDAETVRLLLQWGPHGHRPQFATRRGPAVVERRQQHLCLEEAAVTGKLKVG